MVLNIFDSRRFKKKYKDLRNFKKFLEDPIIDFIFRERGREYFFSPSSLL